MSPHPNYFWRNFKGSRHRICENFEQTFVEPNYGFHYKKHFRRMLCAAIGEVVIYDVEKQMDQLKRQQLESVLNDLNKIRNSLAHTYIKGITQNIDAPSRTLDRFNFAYSGLKEFEKEIFSRI